MAEFLHRRKDFGDLLTVIASRDGIAPALVEKDYWIMHCLWGLKQQDFRVCPECSVALLAPA